MFVKIFFPQKKAINKPNTMRKRISIVFFSLFFLVYKFEAINCEKSKMALASKKKEEINNDDDKKGNENNYL